MLMENCELRATARKSLANNWGMAAICTLVYSIIVGAASSIPFIGTLVYIFVGFPIMWGFIVLFLDHFRGGELELGKMFNGFKDYGRILGTMFLMNVYIFLWSLLLIIPGLIKGYSYAMTPYLLKDEPELSFNAAIEKSMEMMTGNKMKLFLLDLSFIGWMLLCILTLGIGFLWLIPYMQESRVAFYEDLKKNGTSLEA